MTGCSEADNIKTLTIQVQKTAETANNSLLQQATFAAECRKARATKRAKYGTQGINSGYTKQNTLHFELMLHCF